MILVRVNSFNMLIILKNSIRDIKYERAVDQQETFAGEMILQIILLIVFLAWTLKRNLGEVISKSYLSYYNKLLYPFPPENPEKTIITNLFFPK
jgi:hypothetical protein